MKLDTSSRACRFETEASGSTMSFPAVRPTNECPRATGKSRPANGPSTARRTAIVRRPSTAVRPSGPRLCTATAKPEPIGASLSGTSGCSGSIRSAVGAATASVSTSPSSTFVECAGSVSAMRRATSPAVASESAVTTMSTTSAPTRCRVSLTFTGACQSVGGRGDDHERAVAESHDIARDRADRGARRDRARLARALDLASVRRVEIDDLHSVVERARG